MSKAHKALQVWRDADHADAIQLSRHEVITLIDEYAATIEECARVADGYQGPGWKATPGEIARAIRALKNQ